MFLITASLFLEFWLSLTAKWAKNMDQDQDLSNQEELTLNLFQGIRQCKKVSINIKPIDLLFLGFPIKCLSLYPDEQTFILTSG